MKIKYDKSRGRYRIIIPGACSENGRRQVRFFKTKQDAEAERRKRMPSAAFTRSVSEAQHAALIMAESLGVSEHQFLDAMKHYQKTVLAVKRPGATVEEAAEAYLKYHEEEQSNPRTGYKYNSTLNRLRDKVGPNLPMVELTKEKIDEYLDIFKAKEYKPGTRRAQYANVHAFINWCLEKQYLAIDPLAHSKPVGKWGSKDEPLGIEEFRRILFVIAGLEPLTLNDAPTMRYIRLLPFYVLGGLAGMRRCEIISSYPNDPVVDWSDINWQRNWIYVRHEVAKETHAKDRSRYVTLEPSARAWLELIIKPSGKMMEISQSTLQRLNLELLDRLKIEVPSNGLRNGFASWGATFRTRGEVAKEMGDLESTVEKFYIKRREPDSGRAWFNIYPGTERKIVPMEKVA